GECPARLGARLALVAPGAPHLTRQRARASAPPRRRRLSLSVVEAVGDQPASGAGQGLWALDRRALTVGLVLTTTFIATEALVVITIMPQVARELGGLTLYGWVFSAFMLGSLVGTVAAGREADRTGPVRPYLA